MLTLDSGSDQEWGDEADWVYDDVDWSTYEYQLSAECAAYIDSYAFTFGKNYYDSLENDTYVASGTSQLGQGLEMATHSSPVTHQKKYRSVGKALLDG